TAAGLRWAADRTARLRFAQAKAPVAVRNADEAWLAQQFAQEPELILACVESLADGAGPGLEAILAASERAARGRRNYADLHYFAGRAAAQAGADDRALQFLETAIEMNPRYRDALILAARIHHRRGDLQRAAQRIEQALSLGADYPDVHLLHGNICEAR